MLASPPITRHALAEQLSVLLAAVETAGDLSNVDRKHVLDDTRSLLDAYEAESAAAPGVKPIPTRDRESASWRAPSVPDGHEILFDEPGRVLNQKAVGGRYDVCYRSFWYRVTKSPGSFSELTLRVRHGGGEEELRLGSIGSPIHTALAMLDSDARFFVLHELRDSTSDAETRGRRLTEHEYETAFVEGRLKKRKRRGQDAYDVTIVPRDITGG